MSGSHLLLDIWSDYVCPYCYLELPVLERLREEFGDRVLIEWHAYELRPDPVPTLDPGGDYLRSVWARSVYPMAEQRNMVLRLPPMQPRSRKALEAAEFARERGRFDPMHEAIFRAFFEHGRDIGSVEVLIDVGAGIGLDGEALRAALESDRHTARVLEDEATARRLGVTAVPTLVARTDGQPLEAGVAVSGALAYPQLREIAVDLLAAK